MSLAGSQGMKDEFQGRAVLCTWLRKRVNLSLCLPGYLPRANRAAWPEKIPGRIWNVEPSETGETTSAGPPGLTGAPWDCVCVI
jgi:hypothetical protein